MAVTAHGIAQLDLWRSAVSSEILHNGLKRIGVAPSLG